MIQHILLVAMREFRQIAMTRSFWVTLLILPLAFAVGPIASRFMDKSDTESVMLVDQSGGDVARTVARQLDLDRQRAVMNALSRYVVRHDLQRAAPDAVWARQGRWFSDADIDGFVAAGGQKAALARIARVSPGDAKSFEAPDADYRIEPTPPEIAQASPAAMDSVLAPYLRPADKSGRKPIDYVVLIPRDFGKSPVVRLWANGQPRTSFVGTLQRVLTERLRTGYLQANGVAAPVAVSASLVAPAIQITTPPEGSGRERVLIRSILPLASAYLLLMSLVLSGSWMLQGTVEERSNKLLETVLACISPNELMYGKLIGTVAVGLSMVATWVACGIFAAYATHGAIADVIRPALEPVSSPGSIATIAFFFVAGYLMVSMIFLAIGAMSDSMRDAQGYLTPVILLIMMPFTLLVQAVLRGAGGIGIQVMTWVPLYTPFAVLARLGSGIPAWEAIGSGLLLVAFIVVEIILLGRVFRASLLNGGQRPSLAGIVRLMRSPT
ncbi:MAG: ABC transporter permease [Sphingomonas sp.]